MLTAELLDKAVITTAAANSTLSTDAVGDKLKYCLCIVIKTSYNCGVNRVFNSCGIKIFLNCVKVVSALVTKIVCNLRCILCNTRTNRTFAVKDSHWVLVKTRKAGVAQLVLVTLKI